MRRSLRNFGTAVLLIAIMVGQGAWALAGVTGGLTGTVIDTDTSAPVAGATVTASSPSQVATVSTDAAGHFSFLTLAPDTYTVTVAKSDYQSTSVPGQVVFADTVQTITVRVPKLLKTIARVTSAAAGALVKSGTTADVYSINQSSQRATSALGGGGNLNSAYSAISTVPGAYVVPNQSGYFDTVHIRGGDFDQVGYEFDGVPVNRSFDNYPSGAASSLGNAEVQVYTGANPANSEGQGLAGYVNQVIRTGTYPGFADGQLSIGTPVYYHRAMVEAGGATPDRLFSYYLGVAGYNQGFRYVDSNNGASYDSWLGQPLAPFNGNVPNAGQYVEGGYFLGPFNWMNFATIASRDAVANVHFAIPHHNDAGRDDVQLLYDSSMLRNSFYSSNNDIASPNCSPNLTGSQCWGEINPLAQLGVANGLPPGSTTPYIDGLSWNCQSDVGGTFTVQQLLTIGPSCTRKYFYPFSSQNRPWSDFATGSSYGFVPNTERDSSQNQQEVVKLQYTKNFGSTAFFRIYGYTYYSTWDLVGPQCTAFFYACPTAPDYELSSHTRGVSAQFQDQIDAENLISLQGSYVTASTIRDNNTQMYNNFAAFGGPNRVNAAVVVNAADPYSGYCYNAGGGQPVTCNPGVGESTSGPSGAQFTTWDQLYEPGASGGPPTLPTKCIDPNVPGKTACTYLLAENGLYATYNNVQPRFAALSFTDEFRPNDKILLNLGVRDDSFTFIGLNGNINNNGGIARQFWYNAYNRDTCVNNITGVPVDKTGLGIGSPTSACPNGYHAAALVNQAYQSFTFNEWQPRFSGTYSLSPDTVIRASVGRYTEAPNTAYEIYNTLENDIPFALLGPNLSQYGRTSPGLPVNPPTSLNYDLSLEHHFKGTDLSFKITPFLRQTQDQVQNFYLNQATGFISGLNVGSQRSQGVEFQLQKGDFSRNGISGLLSFAYTNSYIKYGTLSTGATIISPINVTISNYNAYTAACAKGGSFYGKSQYGIPLCGTGVTAAKCYTGGSPSGCSGSKAVLNPYWNQPGQNFIDPTQNFPVYDIFPAGIGSSANSFNSPYVASMVLNYKWDKLSLTPSFQFQGGARYGAPETTPGINPASPGCIPLEGGAHRYDATQCPASLVIPDQFTGVFDDLGSFAAPNEFMVNFQAAYDVSPRLTLTAVLANIVNTCWGGSKEAWTYTDSNICTYTTVGNGLIPPVGNNFNPPGSTSKIAGKNAATIIQKFLLYPYEPALGPFLVSGLNNSIKSPFQAYFEANLKI